MYRAKNEKKVNEKNCQKIKKRRRLKKNRKAYRIKEKEGRKINQRKRK